jgi:Na+-transporting NADH:ubiquinone oxidoreductase subunit NqrA
MRNHCRAQKLCYPALNDVPRPAPDEVHACKVLGTHQQARPDAMEMMANLVSQMQAQMQAERQLLREELHAQSAQIKQELHAQQAEYERQNMMLQAQNQQLKEELLAQRERIDQLLARPSAPSSSNTTTTFNIIVNDLNNPDLSHMPAERVQQLFLGMTSGLMTLIKDVFFNPDIPQNHCLRLTSKKQKMAKIREHGGWVPICMNEGIDKTIHQSSMILCRKFIWDAAFADFIMREHDMVHTWFLRVGSKCGTEWRPLRNAVKCNLLEQYEEERRQVLADQLTRT